MVCPPVRSIIHSLKLADYLRTGSQTLLHFSLLSDLEVDVKGRRECDDQVPRLQSVLKVTANLFNLVV